MEPPACCFQHTLVPLSAQASSDIPPGAPREEESSHVFSAPPPRAWGAHVRSPKVSCTGVFSATLGGGHDAVD